MEEHNTETTTQTWKLRTYPLVTSVIKMDVTLLSQGIQLCLPSDGENQADGCLCEKVAVSKETKWNWAGMGFAD